MPKHRTLGAAEKHHCPAGSGGDADGSADRCLGMRLEPIARRTLRTTDLGIGHLLGDFPASLCGILVATHRRDVEPLVRLHQIYRDARARGIDHAEAETILGILRFGAPRRDFHARHFSFLFFFRPAPPQGCPANRLPVARPVSSSAAIFGIKFEWQFK